MGRPTFDYFYQSDLDRTTAVLDGRDIAIALRPCRRPDQSRGEGEPFRASYEMGFFADDGEPLIVFFSGYGLDLLIAELQRMKSGCFDQEWPRPVHLNIEADVAELARLLVEGGDEMEDQAYAEAQMERWLKVTSDYDSGIRDYGEVPEVQPLDTVAGFVNYLEENFSASDSLETVYEHLELLK